MTVPKHEVDKSLSLLKVPHENKGVLFRSMLSSEKEIVKKFMLNYFYTNASVPKALRLKETLPAFNYLEDELKLMLDSPACMVSIDGATNEVIAAIINTVWKVDDSFEHFQVDPVNYLNIAAEIAHEVTNDPLLRIVIWRDYQFQLIYHLLQVNMTAFHSKLQCGIFISYFSFRDMQKIMVHNIYSMEAWVTFCQNTGET